MFRPVNYLKVLGCSTALAISSLLATSTLGAGDGVLLAGWATASAAPVDSSTAPTTTPGSTETTSTSPDPADLEFLAVPEKKDNWWRLPTIQFDGVLPAHGPFSISVERVDGPGRLISAVLNDDGEWILGLDSTNLERALYLKDPESPLEWWFSEAGRYQLTFNVEEEDGTKETYALGFLVGDDGELSVDESHGLGAAFAELGEALRGLDQVIHGEDATTQPATLPRGVHDAPAVNPKDAHYHGNGAAPQVIRAPGAPAPGAPAPGAPAAAAAAPIPARINAIAAPAAPPAPAVPAPPPPPPAPASPSPASPSPTAPLATMPAEEGTQAHPQGTHPAQRGSAQAAGLQQSQGVWGTLAAGGWVSGFMLGVGAMAFIGGFLLFLASLFIRRQPVRAREENEEHYMTSPTHP